MENNWKEITASWKGGSAFTAQNDEGGLVQMGTLDGTPSVGPMQLLLVALAGCTGMDIISILGKKRQVPADFQVKVRAKRAETYPMIWTEIEVTYLLWGNNLKVKDVEQAIKLSEEKYCSVGIMLGASAKIFSTYQILTPGLEAGT